MRLYAALVLSAGCSFQPRAAMISGDGSATHDAAAADALDAPIDGSDDVDGDGVPDAVDNCPTLANADQRDHDVDGRGDICDLCPHIPESTDTDSDGDGVGDACDPRPSTPGDMRALWVGFYDANDIAGWPVNGTDTVSLGRLVIGTTSSPFEYTFPNLMFTNAYAVTSVRATAVGNPSSSPRIETQIGNNTIDQAYDCFISSTTGNATNAGAQDFWTGQLSQAVTTPWTGTFAANSDFTITNEVVAAKHTCTLSQGMTTATPVQTAGPHAGLVLLGSTATTAAFDYLFVVEMGP